MKPVVLFKAPRAGLANKLIIWAHALTFAKENNLKLYETHWAHIPFGPFIRKEKTKRVYFNLIKKAPGLPLKYLFKDKIQVNKSNWEDLYIEKSKVYIFNNMPDHNNYFKLINNNKDYIIKSFYNKINPKILYNLTFIQDPLFAIHIRLGDFKLFNTNYKWGFYENLIADIRNILNYNIPVTIFTDGYKEEIPLFKTVKNIHIFYSGNDLIDLLIMSRSKILVPFPGSTYSHWAAFIGNSSIINIMDNNINLKNILLETFK